MTAESAGISTVHARPYRDARDWQAIRALLIDTHPRTSPGFNWDIRRWDGWRFHRADAVSDEKLAAAIGVWETEAGRLVGAVHPEGRGDAYLEIDPDFRDLEPEMIAWAEGNLALTTADGRTIELWVGDEDEARRQLLAARGYTPDLQGGWTRRLRFDSIEPVEPPELAGPYRLRTPDGSDEDCRRMADLLNAGFGRTAHSAAEVRNFVDGSPSYDRALDLVAVTPKGSFAATVGVTYDHANRHGIIEPVCTHPDHRRVGLARALLIEGLARLRVRGAQTASLDTGEGEAANALYIGCGFVDGHHFRAWRKNWRR